MAKVEVGVNAGDAVRALYAEKGVEGIVKALGISPRALLREVDELANREPTLPSSADVFAAFDKAKGEGKEKLVPVLALMGLGLDDLAPGTSPWALRQDEQKRDVLIVVLGDGRKVKWVRE